MQKLARSELAAELRGTRIGLLGFPETLAEEASALLQAAGCVSHRLSETGAAAAKNWESYDTLLVCTGEADPPSRVTELVATPLPWVLIGLEGEIQRRPLLHLRADDVVFLPFSADELVFRIYRALRRRLVGTQPPAERRKSSVLVADDDPNVLALLKSVLVNYGLRCYFATNGRDTLVMVRNLLPDVLVLDIDMPGMNGLEVLRLIRQDPGTRNIKVLLLTASRDFEDIETGSALGADGYLAKPFNHLLLARRIKTFLADSTQPAPLETLSDTSPAKEHRQ